MFFIFQCGKRKKKQIKEDDNVDEDNNEQGDVWPRLASVFVSVIYHFSYWIQLHSIWRYQVSPCVVNSSRKCPNFCERWLNRNQPFCRGPTTHISGEDSTYSKQMSAEELQILKFIPLRAYLAHLNMVSRHLVSISLLLRWPHVFGRRVSWCRGPSYLIDPMEPCQRLGQDLWILGGQIYNFVWSIKEEIIRGPNTLSADGA
jgi:hypothetical protein